MRSLFTLLLLALPVAVFGQDLALQESLVREGAAALATAARKSGDAQRGAVLFHQPTLACRKCHAMGQTDDVSRLGPDLTGTQPRLTDRELVEALLDPSRTIRKGFETVIVERRDGTVVTGILASETPEEISVRDAGRLGEPVRIPRAEIDELTRGTTSLMPAGQVQALAGRQQFLDLMRYLIEVTEGGAGRARELQPPAALFTWEPPAYERTIDHAGMIRDLDEPALKRGEAIYQRLCINCHGTRDQQGSLPTALRFAEGKFKNGPDPYRMYQTLTHGYGFMTPQTWMVPQQKYDVIHYIRETYLKPFNASQYVAINAAYLATLPSGNSRGPAPSQFEPWSAMDYGPSLTSTYEIGRDGSNFAYKGIAVRLDPGPGGIARGRHWQVFDHDTLRMAAAWSHVESGDAAARGPRFIDWQGIHFDGRHQAHPHVAGDVGPANPTGPGWADPASGRFDDPRQQGRDQRRYGPLPRSWGRFLGTYSHGDQIVLSYRVGSTGILEMPGVVPAEALGAAAADHAIKPVFTRTFQVGPRSQPLCLKVATPAGPTELVTTEAPRGGSIARLASAPRQESEGISEFTGSSYFDMAPGKGLDWTNRDFTIVARVKTPVGGTLLCEGPKDGSWQPNGKSLFIRGGRLTYDIGWVGAVAGKANLADDRWHDVAMTWSHETGDVRLYVDGKPDGQGRLKPRGPLENSVVRLGFTSPNFPDPSGFVGRIAEVKFFQERLTDEQLRGKDLPSRPLLAHWSLEAPTRTLRDSTGNGHEGRLGGSVSVAARGLFAGLSSPPKGLTWSRGQDGALLLNFPVGTETLRFVLSVTAPEAADLPESVATALVTQPTLDLESFTRGGPRRWVEEVVTPIQSGPEEGPLAVDVLTVPATNPWFAQIRMSGLDFFEDPDRMAVCSWDGDVWIVRGIRDAGKPTRQLTWRRIASGLFQPLGLKIVDGKIHVTCRDQLAVLEDRNDDGEIDYVRCLNNDHQVTEHFHEFAMGLQTDSDGNFYYAKSARHALPAIVPQHGTLLRVSRDGSETRIVANGFRAANGVCLNPDGSFIVTDQEGHWNPKNRINWVQPAVPGQSPRFYGNLFGYHDVTDPADSAMEPPLCWITNAFDRSPAELLWVDSPKWGPLNGSLLNLSYGQGKVFVVPFDRVSDPAKPGMTLVQGGMCELPLPTFPTGIMRGRFHPVDGHLYVCGMFAWAGNVTQPGGFYRIRATGRPIHVPIGLSATKQGMTLRFSGELDPAAAADPTRYTVQTWSLRRTANYGSKHYDEKTLEIRAATLGSDRKTVTLELPEIQPTWCMSIAFRVTSATGEPVNGLIHNTIHVLPDSKN